MKIGILGGTFDPIHKGHLALAEAAYRELSLDEVWFLPNGNPPHKADGTVVAPAAHRLEMVKCAISGSRCFRLQLSEADSEQTHYSYRTLEELRHRYPENEYYFIIGADSLFSIESWAHPEILLRECVLLVSFRDGKAAEEMQAQSRFLSEKYGARIRLLHMPQVDISSSEIRRMRKHGESVRAYVPEAVLAYMEQHSLYTENWDFKAWKDMLCKRLTPHRYDHTLGVAYTAAAMAMAGQADVNRALAAGLLHDCAKGIPEENLEQLCERYQIPVSEAERRAPQLLHAKVGAYLAETKYNVCDQEILDAIRFHTTGRPHMTLLEKIIYIADYIEPGRSQAPHLDDVRRLAFTDVDGCLYRILRDSLDYLHAKGAAIDPMTEETFAYYRKETGETNDGESKIHDKTDLAGAE